MVKDTLCRDFLNGHCPFENRCKFEHPEGKGTTARKSEANVCKDYARGNCSYGERCRFNHPVPCKDFLAGKCTFVNCKFYHPPGAAGARAPSGKRPMDGGGYDELPPEFCRDFVYNGVCRRPRCSYLHEIPNKRHRSGPDGPYPGGPAPSAAPGPVGPYGNDGPSGGTGGYVAPELKAYVGQLELKVTMYEEKIKDLEKRCEQYEDFNKLLTERNDELKEKLDRDLSRGGGGNSGGYISGGTGGGYNTGGAGGGYSSSNSRNNSSSRSNYY